jgi:putative Holliday junction resolvase
MDTISALGLDIGRKRIGVAGCDRLGLLATELTTLENLSFGEIVTQLQRWIQERQVEVVVVGLPYTLSGELGSQARKVQSFAQRLSAAVALPVEYVDERLTSYHAEQMLLSAGKSPRRQKALVDRKAAALILQQWLDQRARAASSPS